MAGYPVSDDLRLALQKAYEQRKLKDKWTEQKVADLAGCSKTTVHHIVSATSHRPAKGSLDLSKVCEVLGVDMGAFLPLDDEQRALLRALSKARVVGRSQELLEHVESALKLMKLTAPDRTGSS